VNNQIKTYSFKEADELFGIQYQVKETGKIENFPDELPFSVETILRKSFRPESDVEKIFDNEKYAVQLALLLNRNRVSKQLEARKDDMKILNQLGFFSSGGLFLLKKYRKHRKKVKTIISRIERQAFKVDYEVVYVREEDIFVNKNKVFHVHDQYEGNAYYLNIKYEHTNTLPIYAKIRLKFRGFQIVDDIYYHNYISSSILGDMDDGDQYMIENQGFSYGLDENYNGHINQDGVLFTFSNRSKIYSSKESLKNDLNIAIESTKERFNRFGLISKQL